MKNTLCSEFLEYLDILSQEGLSDELKQHLDSCPDCRREYARIAPMLESLLQAPSPAKLSEKKLEQLTAAAIRDDIRRSNRRSGFRVMFNVIIALPIVLGVNWLWLTMGSSFLTRFISPDVARVFVITFLMAATCIAALVFGLIPILWGSNRPHLSDLDYPRSAVFMDN